MKLNDLLRLMDGDTYLQLIDVESGQYVEADADNTLLQCFGEAEVKEVFASNTIDIKIQIEKG